MKLRIYSKKHLRDSLKICFNQSLKMKIGYSKYDYQNSTGQNYRNGSYTKTLKSNIAGEFDVEVPRDRNGEYEPKTVKKYQTDISSIDDKIPSMHAKGDEYRSHKQSYRRYLSFFGIQRTNINGRKSIVFVLENFTEDLTQGLQIKELPELPQKGGLDIEEISKS